MAGSVKKWGTRNGGHNTHFRISPVWRSRDAAAAPRASNFYLYSFDGKLPRQYDVSGVLLKDFIYMGNRLVAEYDRVGNRYLYYTPDQISSTRVVTDSTGTVVYSEAFNPYGGVRKTWEDGFDPLPKFSGKERDKESGLDYFLIYT